jgi:hypothetical protein
MSSQGKSGESTRFVPARFKEEPLFYKEGKEEIMMEEEMLVLALIMISSVSFSLIFGKVFSKRK